ncbi:hypothetical protein F4777DRAFT_586302 [Nemania sp. FL0916]|nr:hypothetical protein F4777DRAFT_586302 [Nemania sp. FL0916]
MDNTVYLGLWTNWSRGAIFGVTLTTTKSYGNLLISFTAVFIALVTTRLWRILCLLLHRCYSTGEPRGAVHHQRQVVLRNSASPEAGLFDIVRLGWAWRSSGPRRIIGLLPLLLFAFIYLVGFTVVGGFSSSISTAVSDEVLVRSTTCDILGRFAAEKSNNAANYGQQCYNTSSSGSDRSRTSACNIFIRGNLPTAVINYASDCPFEQKICRDARSTIYLDSGYIDSHNDLGSNAPESARIAVRYRCSLITSNTFNGTIFPFTPISELARPDGDLTLIFLSGNRVRFAQKMDDSWYRATQPYSGAYYPGGPLRDWCNKAYPKEAGCGPLASQGDAIYGAAPLFNLTNEDLEPSRPSPSSAPGARLTWFWVSMLQHPTTVRAVLTFSGVKSLASQTRFRDGIQFALPENQWQLDVINWWNIILAGVQASCILAVDAAQGFSDPEFLSIRTPPLTNEAQRFCNNQKIRSSAHTSFSFFGLAFTFIVGALIIAASYSIEPVLVCLHNRKKYKTYSHLEWISNGNLQLHRLAHEESGETTWQNCDEEIPVTTAFDDSLARLDITNPSHPTLQRPTKQEVANNTQEDTHNTSDEERINSFENPDGSSDAATNVSTVTPQLEPEIEDASHFISPSLFTTVRSA